MKIGTTVVSTQTTSSSSTSINEALFVENNKVGDWITSPSKFCKIDGCSSYVKLRDGSLIVVNMLHFSELGWKVYFKLMLIWIA